MPDLPSHAIVTNQAMGAADRATMESGRFTGPELMERAGAAVADALLARWPAAAVIDVLCGPGNNGGDGYVAARMLAERGCTVRLYALAQPKAGTDAERAAARWVGRVEPLEAFETYGEAVVIDALFGAGFSGRLPEPAKASLDRAAVAGCAVLAVDLPSGINGDTGQGSDASQSAATVTFYRKKPGHLLHPGRALCGQLVVADIGVRADVASALRENVPVLWAPALPVHGPATHKYEKGAVAVWSGPRHGSGASRLSAMAAQRAGAGAVTLLGHPDALDIHAAHVSSIMLRRAAPADALAIHTGLKGLGAVVVGPGLGDFCRARTIVEAGLSGNATMVIDADAITAHADAPETLFERAAIANTVAVLTPHEGEFARLFPDIASDENIGKLDKAMAAAARAHAVVVYKGPDSVIAAPDGRAAINTNATSTLATAGSGDVLAGMIAGLAAQGMPGFEAACAAVWLHGQAGRVTGRGGNAEDLVSALPTVWAQLGQCGVVDH